MSSTIPPTPPSPGVGMRRKGPKTLPRLPLSAFTPPPTGTSERFPLPSSPSTVHPDSVIDANIVVIDGDVNLNQWKKEAGQVLGPRVAGVVLSMPGVDLEKITSQLGSNTGSPPIISLVVPFNLEDTQTAPLNLSSSPIPKSLSTVFTKYTPESIASLKWALEAGRPVDIDVQSLMSDTTSESFDDMLSKATADLPIIPPIILSNILPPPHDLGLPIVKLMNHPTYQAFQSQVAALSLFPDVYAKFLPPSWDAPTPASTSSGSTSGDSDLKLNKEWKRRIKMYLGPVMEAFGYQRIIFGSSPSPTSKGSSSAGDWYELARESLAELGVEQEFIDAVFYGNAKKVYGSMNALDD